MDLWILSDCRIPSHSVAFCRIVGYCQGLQHMDMDIDGVLPPGVVLPPGGGDFFANFFSRSFF